MLKKSFKIRAEIWLYSGDSGAWYFVTLPKKESAEIKKSFGDILKKGWGSVPVMVKLGKSIWKTSIFPDKKRGAYILPIKAAVRKREKIEEGNIITLSIFIDMKICSRGHKFSGSNSCYVCWPGLLNKERTRKVDSRGIRIKKFGQK